VCARRRAHEARRGCAVGRPACEPACLLGVGAGCGAGAAHGEALDLVDEHADEGVVVLEDLLPGGRYREI